MFSYTFWHHVCHISSLTKQMWLSDSISCYFVPLLIPHSGSLEGPESIPPGHVTNLLQCLTERLNGKMAQMVQILPPIFKQPITCVVDTPGKWLANRVVQTGRFGFWLIFYFYFFLNQFVFNFTHNHLNIGLFLYSLVITTWVCLCPHSFQKSSGLLGYFIGVTKMAVEWQDLSRRTLLALTPPTKLQFPVHPTCMSLDCGRRQELPGENYTANSSQKPVTSEAFRLHTVFVTKGTTVWPHTL